MAPVSGPVETPRRGPLERALAWVVTGPLGHLYSVVADLAVFAARSLVGRARRRLQGRRLEGEGRRPSARR